MLAAGAAERKGRFVARGPRVSECRLPMHSHNSCLPSSHHVQHTVISVQYLYFPTLSPCEFQQTHQVLAAGAADSKAPSIAWEPGVFERGLPVHSHIGRLPQGHHVQHVAVGIQKGPGYAGI